MTQMFSLRAENPFTGQVIIATADPDRMPGPLRALTMAMPEIGYEALEGCVRIVVQTAAETGRSLDDVAAEICQRADGDEPFVSMTILQLS